MQFIVTDKVSFCTVSMTNDLGFADWRNFYEKWSRDGQRIAELLFAGNSLAKAQRIFERFIQKRPRSSKEVGCCRSGLQPSKDDPYKQYLDLASVARSLSR